MASASTQKGRERSRLPLPKKLGRRSSSIGGLDCIDRRESMLRVPRSSMAGALGRQSYVTPVHMQRALSVENLNAGRRTTITPMAFTPGTDRRLSTVSNYGRLSTGMGSGRSSMGPKKDIRSDTQGKSEAIKKIVSFLHCCGRTEVTLKNMRSPTHELFWSVFLFIYKQIDPSYEQPKCLTVARCISQEVPKLLKRLSCPYTRNLAPKIFESATSMGSWPYMLMGMSHMLEVIEATEISPNLEDMTFKKDFESLEVSDAIKDKAFFDACYKRFMAGDDYCKDLEEQFKEEHSSGISEEQLDRNQEKISSLEEEIERLRPDCDALKHMKGELGLVEADIVKLKDYNEGMVKHIKDLDAKGNSLIATIFTGEESKKETEKRIKEIREEINNQEMSIEDVKKIRKEMEELKQTTDRMMKRCEKIEEEEIFKKQMDITKMKERVEELCMQHNRICFELGLADPDDPQPEDPILIATAHPKILHRTYVQVVQPALEEVATKYSLRNEELEEDLGNMKEALKQLSDKERALRQELEDVEGDLKRGRLDLGKTESEREKIRQAYKQEIETKAMKLSELIARETEMEEREETAKATLKELQEKTTAKEKRVERVEQECKEDIKEVQEMLQAFKTKVSDSFKEDLAECRKRTNAAMEEMRKYKD